MKNIIKKLFNKAEPPKVEELPKVVKPKKPRKPKAETPKTAKEIATANREPYISIVNIDLDPENIGNGAFELDWNEYFIAQLFKSGYAGKDDAQIVDQWFQDICRNVVLETFEQHEANNPRPVSGIQRKDLGGGKTEVS